MNRARSFDNNARVEIQEGAVADVEGVVAGQTQLEGAVPDAGQALRAWPVTS